MLVLSRRRNEKLIFPSIQTTIQIVAIKPGVVRLGIDAPSHIQVFREEIMDPTAVQPLSIVATVKLRELNHVVRNRLNAGTVGLALLRRQLKAGLTTEGEATLEKIAAEFQTLREHIEQTTRALVPMPTASARRKALLVEDDRNERELLAGFLRMAGLEVVTAGDGSDALDYLRTKERPDVVLLDMVLPRCDGPTTVREIRRDPDLNNLKIFAVTGHDPERFGLAAEGSGVDRWFHKPLNPEDLLRDLRRELGDRPASIEARTSSKLSTD